ncbi:hypothetical protein HMPREF1581_00986 [Gardnerella vaginalis JCP8108]|uniref:Uncharacterized protein n=1 Tax=Gardnerella vaginalis JCP8108 TaxID=1261066 RepID=S4GET5_GARVA|nr:hypothetical protein HMPREF1581_00986 [Gardnerella vaginalis JCP8108]
MLFPLQDAIVKHKAAAPIVLIARIAKDLIVYNLVFLIGLRLSLESDFNHLVAKYIEILLRIVKD